MIGLKSYTGKTRLLLESIIKNRWVLPTEEEAMVRDYEIIKSVVMENTFDKSVSKDWTRKILHTMKIISDKMYGKPIAPAYTRESLMAAHQQNFDKYLEALTEYEKDDIKTRRHSYMRMAHHRTECVRIDKILESYLEYNALY